MKEVVSRQTATRIPFRVLTFLRAIGTSDGIRQALSAAGYTQADNDHAWHLLLKIAGREVQITPAVSTTAASKAMVELDHADEPLLRRAEAVLRRFHPAQAEFVFAHLTPGQGAAAVLSVATFLGRLDRLEHGPEREGTRAEDHAALATLAARGITADERARLAELVKVAQQMAAIPPAPEPPDTEQASGDLMALRAWYQDWSETARAVIKRRDYLVRLGLSKRRTRKKDAPTIAVAGPSPSNNIVGGFGPPASTNGASAPVSSRE